MRPSTCTVRALMSCLVVLALALAGAGSAAAQEQDAPAPSPDGPACRYARPKPRVPLSAQLRDAAFVGLVRVDQVQAHHRGRLPHAVPVGEHPVAEAARGARELLTLQVSACVDAPVWVSGALVIVSGTPGDDGTLRLGPWSARFPLGMSAARQAWSVVSYGLQLAEADGADPAPWIAWLELLLATPSLRDDGLFEVRAIIDRKPGALELPRGELPALRPALLALLDEPACREDPAAAELSARVCHDLGWDVSAWVLDRLGDWQARFPTAPFDLRIVGLLDTARFTSRQRELVVRLRAQHERGDLESARATVAQLLESLEWRERSARESAFALSDFDLIPADAWLVRLDGQPYTRAALDEEVELPRDFASLPESAAGLALGHFAREVFAEAAHRDPEAAWVLESLEDPDADPENPAALLCAWTGVLSRELWPHYGGRCAVYDLGGAYAFEATAAMLRDRAAEGRLELHEALAGPFWESVGKPNGGRVFEPDPDDTVDTLFEPFWRRMSGGGPLAVPREGDAVDDAAGER